MSFIKELKRRNVFKVTIAYLVMAWLVTQVADVILSNVAAPSWIFHVLLLFLAIGLPFAIFFAWVYELTPDGIRKESELDESAPAARRTGRKLNYVIGGALMIAVVNCGDTSFDPV